MLIHNIASWYFFYTFHGFTVDIYKNKIMPRSTFVDYAVFQVFPLLVGKFSIERYVAFITSDKKQRTFEKPVWIHLIDKFFLI